MINTQKTHSPIFIMLIGAVICILSFVFTTLILGAVIYYTKDPVSYSGIGALCALLSSSAISALVNTKRSKKSALLPVLSALLFCFVLLLSGILASGGTGALKLLMNALSYMLITLLFSFIGSRRKAVSARRKSARRHNGRAL